MDTKSKAFGTVRLGTVMAVFCSCLLAGVNRLQAQSSTITLPMSFSSVEGAGASAGFSNPLRMQEVYSAQLLPPTPIVIKEIRFRQDSTYYIGGYSGSLQNIHFSLSTTPKAPHALSTTFSANQGPDLTEVYAGAWSFTVTPVSGSGGTKGFEIVLPLQHPFRYDPLKGNLLLDYQNFSALSQRFHTDATSISGGPSSLIFFDGKGDATVASAGAPGADIIQIVYTLDDGVRPTIVAQPVDQTAFPGEGIILSVDATGTPPLYYQWLLNGEAIQGGADPRLSLSASPSLVTGPYSVIVSNAFGFQLSSNVAVHVLDPGEPQTSIVPPSFAHTEGQGASAGLSVRIRFQELYSASILPSYPIIIREIVFRPDSTYSVGAYTGSLARIAFTLSTTAKRPDNLSLTFANNLGSDQVVVYDGPWTVGTANTGPAIGPKDFDIHLKFQHPFLYDPKKGNLLLEYRNYSGLPVRLHTDSISLNGGPGAMVYADGNPDASVAAGGAPGADVITLVYSIQDSVAPILTASPYPRTVVDGDSTSFTSLAIGASPLEYHWLFNELPIDGSNNRTFLIPSVSTASAGNYSFVVSNKVGSVESSAATLLVVPKPAATQVIPTENAAVEGSGVSAALSLPLRQQELYDGSLFRQEPVQITQLRYRLDASVGAKDGGFGVFLSNTTVRLSTTARLPGQLDYKFDNNSGQDVVEVFHGDWLVSAKPFPQGSQLPHDFEVILQLTTPFIYDPALGSLLVETVLRGHSPLLISQDSAAPKGKAQRILIQDPSSALAAIGDTSVAVVEFGYAAASTPPRVFSEPSDRSVPEGSAVEFAVTAGGTKPFTFEWLYNDNSIPNATNSVLRLDHAYLGDAGDYSVRVSNAFGSATSLKGHLNVTPLPTTIVLGNVTAASGQRFTVPVTIRSRGNENGVSFGFQFPSALLSLEGIELSGFAQDPIVNVNTNHVDKGSVGLALILSSGRTLSRGTNDLAFLHFRAAPLLTDAAATLEFTDDPISREVVDPLANPLQASFVNGTASIVFRGFEGDVMPRQTPDRRITLADWVQVGRFVAGLDEVGSPDEFQRADCAPIDTAGDGRLSVMDWVQAGRFAAALDAPAFLGGPTAEVPQSPGSMLALQDLPSRRLELPTISSQVGEEVRVPIAFLAAGGEAALGLSVKFDCAVARFLRLDPSPDVSGMVVNLNSKKTGQGYVGLTLGFPAGSEMTPGIKTLGTLVFRGLENKKTPSPMTLSGVPVILEVVDRNARSLPVVTVNGSLTVSGDVPELRITRTQSSVEVAWPASYSALTLETTTDLSANKWSVVDAARSITGDRVSVTLPVTPGAHYYRITSH